MQSLDSVGQGLAIHHFVVDATKQHEIVYLVDEMGWKIGVIPRPVRLPRNNVTLVPDDRFVILIGGINLQFPTAEGAEIAGWSP